jgi:hypothetical protein
MNGFNGLEKSLHYGLINQNINCIQNIKNIFEKLEIDGIIKNLGETIDKIYDKEMLFAILGKIKRTKKDKEKE